MHIWCSVSSPHPSVSGTTLASQLGGQQQGTSTPQLVDRGRPTFGVDLAEQMIRDSVEVPRVMQRCAESVEAHGLDSVGIYRISGSASKIAKLRERLDRGE